MNVNSHLFWIKKEIDNTFILWKINVSSHLFCRKWMFSENYRIPEFLNLGLLGQTNFPPKKSEINNPVIFIFKTFILWKTNVNLHLFWTKKETDNTNICFMENECEFTFVLCKMDVFPKTIGFINFASGASSTSDFWSDPTNHLKISGSIKIVISQKTFILWKMNVSSHLFWGKWMFIRKLLDL